MDLHGRRWPTVPTERETELLGEVARSRVWTDGPWTAEVERRMAGLTGAPHAVAFNSCTSALHAALHALRAGRGTRVALPSLTFAGTATGARHIGATLLFQEVRPDTLTLGPDLPADADLVIAVDLHGVPHGLDRGPVLTDACQALGTRIGGRHVGASGTHAWSFSAAKMVTAPDGGAVTTSDPALADRLRELRDYGVPAGEHRSNAGVRWPGGHNWRPSELSMAMVAHRLDDLDARVARARDVTDRLHKTMDGLGLWRQHAPDGTEPGWHKVRFGAPGLDPGEARRMADALAAAGVPTHRWGALPLHRHPAFGGPGGPDLPGTDRPDLPGTDRAAAGTLCLGTEACPPMTWNDDEVEQVCTLIETIAEG
ncbi:DegT/DnrJ/EryC1/StrS family aminotransferase [Actinomadura sp. NPDC049382]|uniref:DegT/DnrJ/EryC1/StrS family aminotransferase n=1 Tax=Actinomadura sp. NPDC049382 TaxID=3158220 RepID=UPI00341E7AE0